MWKEKVEKTSNSSFIHEQGRNSRNTCWVWQCHRNGNFIPIAPRKRRSAKKGSKKINAFCPAKIRLVISQPSDNSNNICLLYNVEYISTHVGHSTDVNELVHIRFDKTVQDIVAKKLAAEVPVKRIVKEIRATHSTEAQSIQNKLQLLTKQDVYNVSTLRNVNIVSIRNQRRCPDDIQGVESWVEENAESVLFYKKQDELHSLFKKEDFVLVIMKPEQIVMLQKFGSNVVYLDGTHGAPYDFILHTLLIIDQYEEGYPVCFLITNRNDQIALQVMFSVIKDKVGSIRPKAFMSDMQSSYINAWSAVMPVPEFILWCNYHVTNAWKNNYSKITASKEKREEIINLLKDLYKETDTNEFLQKLHKFISIEDTGTEKFIEYFFKEYASNCEKWAYAYRNHAGINTNMKLERFHHTIKYEYGKGIKIGQLQDLLHILDEFIEDKIEDASIHNLKGKVSYKERLLRKAHDKALILVEKDLVQIVEEENNLFFLVKAISNDNQFYIVEKNSNCTCGSDCKIQCQECKVCAHEFYCSCIENAIRSYMCKHIHLVAMFIKTANLGNDKKNDKILFLLKNINLSPQSNNNEIEIPDIFQEESLPEVPPDSIDNECNELSIHINTTKLQQEFDEILTAIDTKRKEKYLLSMLNRIKATIASAGVKGPIPKNN